ncbi:MAG: hypothetical protein ACFE9T_00605 [Promethearchaeota archaeon]
MDDFLKQLGLSDNAIAIYRNSLGRPSLTYYELYSIIQNISIEEFENCIDELINSGLLIQLVPTKPEILLHYIVIPPFGPIINYYENIKANLANIKNSIQELIVNSLKQIFKNKKIVDMDSVFNVFQNIKKDIEEDTIIQKQEAEDIVEGMEDLNKIKEEIIEFHQEVRSIIQTQFSDLLKLMSSLKNDLIKKISSLEFKKFKKEIIEIVEELFKASLDEIVSNFINKLHNLIETAFNNTVKPVDNISETIFQYRNDFKMLLFNMLNNFESKMNAIFSMIKENKVNFLNEMQTLELKITENLNVIVRNSIDEVAKLNNPIESIMENLFNELKSPDKAIINDIWIIKSVTKVNEEIQSSIINAKNNLLIIIPNLENHLAIDHFGTQPGNAKIKIASSEAHTNSLVKKLKSIKNLEYKTLQNEDFIALKGDDNHLVIGLIQDNPKEPLKDFVGFGSNFEPIIRIFAPIIETTWAAAYSDTFYAAQQTIIQQAPPKKISAIKPAFIKEVKPVTATKISSTKIDKIPSKNQREKIKSPIQTPEEINDKKIHKQSIDKSISSLPMPEEKLTDLTQTLKKNLTVVPQLDDEAGIVINNAFIMLIQQLNDLNGERFSIELQKIANLILEKKGFSVTLHQLRSTINKYKTHYKMLNDFEKNQIIEDINNWKQKLFQ